MTALMKAALWKHPKVVRHLLDAGANVNAKTQGGGTALNNAVIGGSLGIVKMLLDAGAEVNARSFQQATALNYAKEQRHAVVALLRSRGAV